MARNLLNEAEQYLLKHWEDARLLEESVESVRAKYVEICQRVVDAVKEQHPELDASAICLAQAWNTGEIGLGRTSWPMQDNKYPTGLWVYGLQLENLAAEDCEDPSGCIWVAKKKITGFDFAAARAALMAAAQTMLSPQELRSVSQADTFDNLLWFDAPSKKEILNALIDGDGQRFVELFVSQFDFMARFIPAVDQVLQGYVTAKSEGSRKG
jgi:hypothetical protein